MRPVRHEPADQVQQSNSMEFPATSRRGSEMRLRPFPRNPRHPLAGADIRPVPGNSPWPAYCLRIAVRIPTDRLPAPSPKSPARRQTPYVRDRRENWLISSRVTCPVTGLRYGGWRTSNVRGTRDGETASGDSLLSSPSGPPLNTNSNPIQRPSSAVISRPRCSSKYRALGHPSARCARVADCADRYTPAQVPAHGRLRFGRVVIRCDQFIDFFGRKCFGFFLGLQQGTALQPRKPPGKQHKQQRQVADSELSQHGTRLRRFYDADSREKRPPRYPEKICRVSVRIHFSHEFAKLQSSSLLFPSDGRCNSRIRSASPPERRLYLPGRRLSAAARICSARATSLSAVSVPESAQ